MFTERRKIIFYNIKNSILVNLKIIMNENMTHFHDFIPWSIWMCITKRFCQLIGGFANNLNIFYNTIETNLIGSDFFVRMFRRIG